MNGYKCSSTGLASKIRDFVHAVFVADFTEVQEDRRRGLEDILVLSLFGNILFGVPFPNSYYAPRFLPYFLPELEPFRRRILRERDMVEKLGKEDIG